MEYEHYRIKYGLMVVVLRMILADISSQLHRIARKSGSAFSLFYEMIPPASVGTAVRPRFQSTVPVVVQRPLGRSVSGRVALAAAHT